MNYLHSLRTKSKLESHKTVCENKDFCSILLPSEATKILEFNQYQKPDKAPFIIYADLKCININIFLYQILVVTLHGKYKKLNKNNRFKISAPTCNEEFGLPDGSYSISDIQDYFECILKKHGEKTFNPSIRIYINEIENRVKFKNKTEYYLKLLRIKKMKLLGSTKSKVTKDENGENVPF